MCFNQRKRATNFYFHERLSQIIPGSFKWYCYKRPTKIDGLHDFGQDFISSLQQIDVYKGSSGAHFGPNAIAGAINLITDIDYNNSYSIGVLIKRILI